MFMDWSHRDFNEYAAEIIKQVRANTRKMLGNLNRSIKGIKSYKSPLTGVYAPNDASRKNIPAAIIIFSTLSVFRKKLMMNAAKQIVPKLRLVIEISDLKNAPSSAVTCERRQEINDCGENGPWLMISRGSFSLLVK